MNGRSRARPGPGAVQAFLAVILALAAVSTPAAGQVVGARESELLRAAATREANGDLDGAETALRTVLEANPASVAALLSLERVLRVQGRLDEMPPLLDSAVVADPRSAVANQLRLRTYSRLDREQELERAARQWITVAPRLEVPYREAAAVWRARGEYDRALAVLEEGREAIGRPDALALPMGDLHAAAGSPESAVSAWGDAIDPQGRGAIQVQDRIRDHPEARPYVPALVDRLAVRDAPVGRLEAALELAMDAGLDHRARAVGERLVASLTPPAAVALLSSVARRADDDHAIALAYWAYGALLDAATRLRYADPGAGTAQEQERETERLVAIRTRLAELALALGDSAAAAAGYRELEQSYAQGSPRRRAATALRIELTAREDPGAGADAFRRFRDAYPDAPELDRLAAVVGAALAAAGRTGAADSLLADVEGPWSSALRGRLRLERGDVDAARAELMAAAPELEGAEATRVLRLVALLDRVSPAGARRVGEALRLWDAGQGAEAVARLARAGTADDRAPGGRAATDTPVGGLLPGDVPPLLELAAELADRAELRPEALEIRRRIVEDYPDAPETPAALLALGRALAEERASQAEAREYLERLIIKYGHSALVPEARRLLEGLR